MKSGIASTLVLLAAGIPALVEPPSGDGTIPIAPGKLSLAGVRAESVLHDGREAIRLLEADDTRASGIALVKGVSFRDGTLELDVAGQRGPYALPEDRGFIGIAFRVSPGGDRFEYLYLRPENGRADDQVRRNHSVQYASHPDFPWQRMRKEFPERYESYVDLEPGVWTSIRVEVSGTRARLFVHGANEPTLLVDDLRLGETEGGIALWIGAGTEGFFSNLRVRPALDRSFTERAALRPGTRLALPRR